MQEKYATNAANVIDAATVVIVIRDPLPPLLGRLILQLA